MPHNLVGFVGNHVGIRRVLSMPWPKVVGSRYLSSKAEQDAAALSESIKKLMRSSAQSVAIVSAFLPENKSFSKPRHIHAATLSSFTTVCLAPPLVAFSIRQPSRIADALRDGAAVLEESESAATLASGVRHDSKRPHFLVHLLSSHQTSISDYFARPGAQPYEVASDIIQKDHPFELHPMQPSQTIDGQLILKEALGTMACSLVYQLDLTSPDLHGTTHFEMHNHAHEAGSILFIAQIHAVELGHGADPDQPGRPLVYWNKQYCIPSEKP